MEGPEIERKNVAHLAVRKWSNMELGLRELGHLKQAHIDDAERTILPQFTSYWEDFKPFILELILAFFPERASKPNSIDPDTMAKILEAAEKVVEEPPSAGASGDTAVVDTEMHGYNVLKYGKDYRRGQEEAPRKRIKTTKPSSPPPPRSSARRSSARISSLTSSSHTGTSRTASKLSRLRNNTQS